MQFNNERESAMLKRHYITPENSYKVGGNKQVIYTPVIVVEDESAHSHIYLAGRTSRTLDGDVACKGDMRGQIREVCIAMQIALESVGATLADVTRATTYTTDMKSYFAAIDERFKYFKPPYPTSTLIATPKPLTSVQRVNPTHPTAGSRYVNASTIPPRNVRRHGCSASSGDAIPQPIRCANPAEPPNPKNTGIPSVAKPTMFITGLRAFLNSANAIKTKGTVANNPRNVARTGRAYCSRARATNSGNNACAATQYDTNTTSSPTMTRKYFRTSAMIIRLRECKKFQPTASAPPVPLEGDSAARSWLRNNSTW